jgi:putative oxidoreductase
MGRAMRNFFYSPMPAVESVGLLVLRAVVGAAFMFHGWPKIQQPMAWMGPEATMPGALQLLAAVAEFGGGAALIIGLLTRLAALGLTVTMAVAASTVHIAAGHPFVGRPGEPSYELAAVYFACSLLFLLTGPGRFSLDRLLFGRTSRGSGSA